MACGILIPQPGIEPGAMAWSPNHWIARELPLYLISAVCFSFLELVLLEFIFLVFGYLYLDGYSLTSLTFSFLVCKMSVSTCCLGLVGRIKRVNTCICSYNSTWHIADAVYIFLPLLLSSPPTSEGVAQLVASSKLVVHFLPSYGLLVKTLHYSWKDLFLWVLGLILG